MSVFISLHHKLTEKCCYRDLSLDHSRSSQPTQQEDRYVNEENTRRRRRRSPTHLNPFRGLLKTCSSARIFFFFNKSSVCVVALFHNKDRFLSLPISLGEGAGGIQLAIAGEEEAQQVRRSSRWRSADALTLKGELVFLSDGCWLVLGLDQYTVWAAVFFCTLGIYTFIDLNVNTKTKN